MEEGGFYCSTKPSRKGRARKGILAPKVMWVWKSQRVVTIRGIELVSFWESGWAWGTPPPSRSIGIIDLGENLKVIYGAQRLRGKILSRRDLGRVACFLPVLLSPWQASA